MKLRDNISWRVEDTARELNRSDGRISEDLMLASWVKTHPQILDFEYVKDALVFVRNKKLKMKLD